MTGQGARDIVQRSLEIAADICVFTNRQISILQLPPSP
jgi:ATP-dependent protease HslVU (ClpYQ) peptidase subunit